MYYGWNIIKDGGNGMIEKEHICYYRTIRDAKIALIYNYVDDEFCGTRFQRKVVSSLRKRDFDEQKIIKQGNIGIRLKPVYI